MRTAIPWLATLVGLLAWQPVAAEPACRIEFSTLNRPAWAIEIRADRIEGDKTRLRLEDGVLFGQLFAEQTRLRIGEQRLSGRLAGLEADLHLERSAEHALLRGPVGGLHTRALATRDSLDLLAQGLAVRLKVGPSRSPGSLRLKDDTGLLVLELTGCQANLWFERPEILALVNWLVHNTDQELPTAP